MKLRPFTSMYPCHHQSQTLRHTLLALSAVAVALVGGCAKPNTGPWNLPELSKAPAFEWAGTNGNIRSLYYTNEPYQGHPTRVFAYYGSPEGRGKVPGMVLVHGGSGRAYSEWVDLWVKRGYAAIAMDLGGCGADTKRLPDGGPDQGVKEKFDDLAKGVKEAWTYHAVAAVIRAHSLLRSMPEVDAQRTGINGSSWGGYLTCICAGLDPRFKLAVPIYGCGFYREDAYWSKQMGSLSESDRELWHSQFDPSRYLPNCTVPTLWLNGTNDAAFPLDIYRKSYELVHGPRTLCVTIGMPHGDVYGRARKEIHIFVDSVLRGGKPLPQFGQVSCNNRKVQASFKSEVPVKAAALLYTADDGDWRKRKWQSLPAAIEGNRVTGELPTDEATAWSLTLTDERDATVSTEYQVAAR